MVQREDIQENMRRGLTEMLILYLLTEGDKYGYQLLAELGDRTNGIYQVGCGSLYGPLYRMLAKGYVTETRVAAGPRRFRNYYHLTETGRAYYDVVLSEYKRSYAGANQLIGWDGSPDA